MITEVTTKIKALQTQINNTISSLKGNFHKLEGLIKDQSLMMDVLQEYDTNHYNTLAKALKITPLESKALTKNYKYISKRSLNRKALELLGVLSTPKRIHHTSKPRHKDNLLVVGNLVSNIRLAQENRAFSSDEKTIILHMINQIQNEL